MSTLETKSTKTVVSRFLEFKGKFHVFNEMSDADILSITHNVRFKKYIAGDIIIKENDKGIDMCYILSGECNIVANRAIVGSIGSNTLIGEISSICGSPRTATIRAVKETTVFQFEIDYSKCDSLPGAFYKFYRNVALSLAAKLEHTNAK